MNNNKFLSRTHICTFSDTYFSTLVCFLIFNVADFVGRYITHWLSVRYLIPILHSTRAWMLVIYILTDTYSTTYTHVPPSQLGNHRYILLVCSFLRLVLIPLFLLCNVQVKGKPRAIPTVFNNDAYPVVFNTILGLTNGYFGSLAMIFGPQ